MEKLLLQDSVFCHTQVPVTVHAKFPQRPYPEHSHDVEEIVIVTHGQGEHQFNGEFFPAQRGSLFYVRVGDWHSFDHVREMNLFNILSAISPEDRQQHQLLLHHLRHAPSHWLLGLHALNHVEHLLVQLEAQSRHADAASPFMVRSLFSQLLVFLWRGRIFTPEQARHPEADHFAGMLAYLNDRFDDDITLSTLAGLCNLSERTLNRRFKECLGITPMQYLLQVRMRNAITLLRTAGHSVTEVAFRCGFADSNYFSTCFRKAFGFAPSLFVQSAAGGVFQ